MPWGILMQSGQGPVHYLFLLTLCQCSQGTIPARSWEQVTVQRVKGMEDPIYLEIVPAYHSQPPCINPITSIYAGLPRGQPAPNTYIH